MFEAATTYLTLDDDLFNIIYTADTLVCAVSQYDAPEFSSEEF